MAADLLVNGLRNERMLTMARAGKCPYWGWNKAKTHSLKVREITPPCPDPLADLPLERFAHKLRREDSHHPSTPAFHFNHRGL